MSSCHARSGRTVVHCRVAAPSTPCCHIRWAERHSEIDSAWIIEWQAPFQERHWLESQGHRVYSEYQVHYSTFMAKRRKRQANPGAELRAIRQQLGLSFRDVYAASLDIAEQCRQPAFEIAPSRLHEIESKNMIPSIHRLHALALIYRRTMNELLSLYGIDVKPAKAT